jgi:hypothetical protein
MTPRATSKMQVVGMLAILMLLVASRGLPAGNATSGDASSTTPGGCGGVALQALNSVDDSLAVSNAEASNYYSDGVASYYNPTYWGVFELGSFSSTATCANHVGSLNVVFLMYNGTGALVANLVIAESQNLTVLGSLVQHEPSKPENAPAEDDVYTAGYSVSANLAASLPIYSSYADYTQPAASEPSTGCGSTACQVNSWTGLSQYYYGDTGAPNDYLAQAGTTGWCNSSGTTCPSGDGGYWAWAEVIGSSLSNSPTINCTSADGDGTLISISGGDTIYTYTINDAYDGGSDSSYSFYVEDVTSSTYCIMSADSVSLTTPYWAVYQTELPNYNSAPLAKFGTVTFSSMKFWNSSGSAFDTPYEAYSDDYYAYNVFESAGNYPTCTNPVTNILTSTSISSSNEFTNEWNTSEYTPALCT